MATQLSTRLQAQDQRGGHRARRNVITPVRAHMPRVYVAAGGFRRWMTGPQWPRRPRDRAIGLAMVVAPWTARQPVLALLAVVRDLKAAVRLVQAYRAWGAAVLALVIGVRACLLLVWRGCTQRIRQRFVPNGQQA